MPDRLGADHWRRRAAEARELAEQMQDQDARWRMRRIASDYEKIAEDAAALGGNGLIDENLENRLTGENSD